MNPIDFPESNTVFLAGGNANTRDVVGFQGKEGGQDGRDVCALCFEPTPEECAAIAAGAPVWLVMLGETLRPTRLQVESPFMPAPLVADIDEYLAVYGDPRANPQDDPVGITKLPVQPHMPMHCQRCRMGFMGCDCQDPNHAAQYPDYSPVQACRACFDNGVDLRDDDEITDDDLRFCVDNDIPYGDDIWREKVREWIEGGNNYDPDEGIEDALLTAAAARAQVLYKQHLQWHYTSAVGNAWADVQPKD